MFHALSYREVQRVPGLTVVIYNQIKVVGSSQEAKGFIFHSCFPFLRFMILVPGRSLLESSELSPLSPLPWWEAGLFLCWTEEGTAPPSAQEGPLFWAATWWLVSQSCPLLFLVVGYTSTKAPGRKTVVKITTNF